MLNKSNYIIIFLLFFLVIFIANNVLASNLGDAFSKNFLKRASDMAGYKDSTDDPFGFISQIIKVALSFLGVIFLILMIYGGYQWMTAGGDEQKVEKAKDLIKNSIIGLIVVIAAYAISYFVLLKFGASTLKPAT